jgi:hypothetical protein
LAAIREEIDTYMSTVAEVHRLQTHSEGVEGVGFSEASERFAVSTWRNRTQVEYEQREHVKQWLARAIGTISPFSLLTMASMNVAASSIMPH